MDPSPIVLPPGMPFSPEDDPYGPYVALSRSQWSELAEAVPWDLDAGTLARLRGLGDPTDSDEVRFVVRAFDRPVSPLYRLLPPLVKRRRRELFQGYLRAISPLFTTPA